MSSQPSTTIATSILPHANQKRPSLRFDLYDDAGNDDDGRSESVEADKDVHETSRSDSVSEGVPSSVIGMSTAAVVSGNDPSRMGEVGDGTEEDESNRAESEAEFGSTEEANRNGAGNHEHVLTGPEFTSSSSVQLTTTISTDNKTKPHFSLSKGPSSAHGATKCIALIDLDCFFVAVERMLNPSLIGVPVAVGQYTKGETLIAVSYEAKALGVKRGMFGFQARKVCPQLKIVQVQVKNEKADLTKYRDASSRVLAIATRFCSRIERASVDEFYLDLTEEARKLCASASSSSTADGSGVLVDFAPGTLFCTEFDKVVESFDQLPPRSANDRDALIAAGSHIILNIRTAIKKELDLDCSAGIAFNKFLAKSIAGIRKPATQIALVASRVSSLCATMPIPKARSLGGKLGEHLMQTFNVEFLGELHTKVGESPLCNAYGPKEGRRLFSLAKGLDDTPVEVRVLPKSLGCSKTFPGTSRLLSRQQVSEWLEKLATELVERLEKDGRRPTTLTVATYSLGSRSTSSFNTLNITLETLMPTIEMLFDRLLESPTRISEIGGITSLGLNLSGFPEDPSEPSTTTASLVTTWDCPVCTFVNESKWLKCEACGTSKSGGPSSSSSTNGKKPDPTSSSSLLAFMDIKSSSSVLKENRTESPVDGSSAAAPPPTNKKTKTIMSSSNLLSFVQKRDDKDDEIEVVEVVDDDQHQQSGGRNSFGILMGEDRAQQHSSSSSNTAGKHWTCKTCTYALNDCRFLRCEMCDSRKN